MAKITIKRNFGSAPNKLLKDNNISLKAKGLYAFMQSKPDDWNFSAIGISSENSDGKSSIIAGLQELESCGWLERIKTRNTNGQWDMEYILHDSPIHYGKSDTVTITENPPTENPPTENRQIIKTSLTKKEKDNTSYEVLETTVSDHTENFNKTSETSEGEIITEGSNLEVLNIPPAVVARGDPGINEIIRAIKEVHKVIDGTNEENRRYGNHLKKKLLEIQGFDGRFYDFIKTLCEKSSKYEKRNTTSCKGIYYNLGKIISSIREETNSGPC